MKTTTVREIDDFLDAPTEYHCSKVKTALSAVFMFLAIVALLTVLAITA